MEVEVGALMCEGNYSMWSEESEFMTQFLANCNSSSMIPPPPPPESSSSSSSSTLWVSVDESSAAGSIMYQSPPFPMGVGMGFVPSYVEEDVGISNYVNMNDLISMDYYNNNNFNTHIAAVGSGVEDDDDEKMGKVQEMMSEQECSKSMCSGESKKKRSRANIPPPVPRKKRGALKHPKVDDDNDNINNNAAAADNRQLSICSQDSSNSMNGGGRGGLTTKTRAGRGSATDPQSLYARKRRERINERLKMLQKLVPNGTKVDISTMLEEAVQYVKFLQLQIKLLSSDDMWMYAPIAYNGMDIGALDYNKISASKPQS